MRNTFGHLFTLTTYGESHGEGIGGVVDGMPAGITVDMDFIQRELDRRRPGQSRITTGRQEGDVVELLSGVFEGKTTGCPIGFLVRNTNQHSSDYENVRDVYRPSHADFTYTQKYGLRDHRGGGRSSARETISRCVGGALAKLALRQLGIDVVAYTSQVGDLALDRDYRKYDFTLIEKNPGAKKAYLDTKQDLQRLGVVPELTYMFIQGHHLFDAIVEPLLTRITDTLHQERENEIRMSAIHSTQKSNELKAYNNSTANVELMLRRNTAYKQSAPYLMLQKDIETKILHTATTSTQPKSPEGNT